jgi:hypothetical protein
MSAKWAEALVAKNQDAYKGFLYKSRHGWHIPKSNLEIERAIELKIEIIQAFIPQK